MREANRIAGGERAESWCVPARLSHLGLVVGIGAQGLAAAVAVLGEGLVLHPRMRWTSARTRRTSCTRVT